ncbi:unnamed protein product [Rhizophagus irregularis]|nr:unnamed protein product [Rhizophagus irregularis]CAB5346270.1 unnamed protein product [Rhizophagus irregularis]
MFICTLPEDCFYEIFKHVSKDDTKTLYNCLLVNRFLCRLIIPILYKDPFSAVNDLKQNYCLIRIYLSCLDEIEKDYLQQNSIEILEDSIPLFDYAKYLENFTDLTLPIECWLIYQLGNLNEDLVYLEYNDYINQLDRKKHLLLQKILFHLFLRKMKNCKELIINSKLFDESFCNLYLFKKNSSNYINLSSLNLIITKKDLNDSKEGLLYDIISIITKNCFNIKDLKITFFSYLNSNILKNSINELIQNQENLNNIHLINPNFFSCDVNRIIDSKRNTLNSINFTNSIHNINHETFEVISNCKNLERLEFNNCRGLTYRNSKILLKSSLKLKELILHNNGKINLFDLSLIRRLGNNLINLSIDQISYVSLRIISRHCFNLKILKIVLSTNRNMPFNSYQYFKIMKIEQLTIYYQHNLLLDDHILKILAENLPDTLYSFTIEKKFSNSLFTFLNNNYNCITPIGLNNFLINCRVNLINLNLDFYLKNNLLEKILVHVKKKKSLKYLGIRSCSFWLGNDEYGNQLLNEIKENGVEIITIKNSDLLLRE